MKLNKYFMLGLAGLAFAACSNEDEGNDILTKGTKQISVTISAGSYGQTKAGSGWTEDADKAINPQNIKLYLLKADGNIVEVKDAQVGSDNVYHNVSPEVTKIAAVANFNEDTPLPVEGNWENDILKATLNMNKYGAASTAPLASKVADLVPNGTDVADGNTMYTATVELATMLSRIELSGNLTCTNLGNSAYSKLALTHIGLNGVHQQFTLGGEPVGDELYDKTNQGGYPVSVPACFYDETSGPEITTTAETALLAGYGYNVLGQPKEMLLKFNTEFKSPVAEGFIVYNPAYLKITGLKTEKGEVTMEPGKIYQITDLEFTEEDLTDLDPGEPTICVTATVKVKNWDIVKVEPEYGK